MVLCEAILQYNLCMFHPLKLYWRDEPGCTLTHIITKYLISHSCSRKRIFPVILLWAPWVFTASFWDDILNTICGKKLSSHINRDRFVLWQWAQRRRWLFVDTRGYCSSHMIWITTGLGAEQLLYCLELSDDGWTGVSPWNPDDFLHLVFRVKLCSGASTWSLILTFSITFSDILFHLPDKCTNTALLAKMLADVCQIYHRAQHF